MLNIEDLKKEYVGKTFNWLTVLDIYRAKSTIIFKCECKCGAIVDKKYNKVLSGHTTSCGCYKYSKEKADKYRTWCKNNPDKVKEKSEKVSRWCNEHPDEVKARGECHSQFLKEHPEITYSAGEKYSEWYKNNPDKVKEKIEHRKQTYNNNKDIQRNANLKLKQYYKNNPYKIDNLIKVTARRHFNKRVCTDYSDLLEVIHRDYVEDLLNGNIKADSTIKTKCPVCGDYTEHKFNNVYRLDKHCFKNGSAPLCLKCKYLYNSSKPEQEIFEYISTFYDGECIRNSRDIISPLELDLYYPEKKIAIEYNGDYWHSDLFKDKDYHYNKFKECLEKGIILVSIFESEWNSKQDLIKSYLKDLFSGVENSLSFVNENIMNNNYPSVYKYQYISNYLPHSYIFGESIVYTCGYSVLE